MNSTLDYTKLRFFSKLIKDYLQKEDETSRLYGNYPSIEAFERQLKARQKLPSNRKLLVQTLEKQYTGLTNSEKSLDNIRSLASENTFTVTTGHQLNLFTGPLYFMYKIVSAINLATQLKKEYPTYNFVPIYWMASEDHDFEEINYFKHKESEVSWENKLGGAVGALSLDGLESVFQQLEIILGGSNNEKDLKSLFEKAYLNHYDLASATQFLVHELFGQLGLVILDANDRLLKRSFVPHMLVDLKKQVCHKEVSITNRQLKAHAYKVQVKPREINLFYLQTNSRKRISRKGDLYIITDTDIQFTYIELENELQEHPERFSPNVLMRPLYQEFILPNLAYIGGGGEIAYWLQLKSFFEKSKVSFPILMLRNSVVWISKRQEQKLSKLGMAVADLFLTPDALTKRFLQMTSNPQIDFSPFEKQLRDLYQQIEVVASCTDITFKPAAKAQAQKQVNELYKLEKRLLRAQKRKRAADVVRLLEIQSELFPNNSLQERIQNFSSIYTQLGDDFFKLLLENLTPFHSEFKVLISS